MLVRRIDKRRRSNGKWIKKIDRKAEIKIKRKIKINWKIKEKEEICQEEKGKLLKFWLIKYYLYGYLKWIKVNKIGKNQIKSNKVRHWSRKWVIDLNCSLTTLYFCHLFILHSINFWTKLLFHLALGSFTSKHSFWL